MQRRRTFTAAFLLGLSLCAAAVFGAAAQTPPQVARISFQIAAGPVAGSYFPVAEALARIISNPPGFGRCEDDAEVCGPVGLIASTRATEGPLANIAAVRSGRVSSALVQGNLAALAFEGAGPFKSAGAFKDLRVLAKLQRETIHLVVAAKSRVKRLADLKGRRIAIDAPASATNVTARAILAAAKLNVARLKLSFQSADQAALDLKEGKIDAFFAIGPTPVQAVADAVRQGFGRLLPIEGAAIAAWVKKQPFLVAAEVHAITYPPTKPTRTLAVAALWVTTAQLPDNVAYGLARAIWNPANRSELDALASQGLAIAPDPRLESSAIPLHAGAAKFYQGAGRLQN
jgi:TRAP transporter TAXI family solute receptor